MQFNYDVTNKWVPLEDLVFPNKKGFKNPRDFEKVKETGPGKETISEELEVGS